MQAFRVACHYGDTETEMDSNLRSTSVVVFNRLVIFVLKEADEIFRKLLGVTTDAELASGAVKKQPRYASQLYPCCTSHFVKCTGVCHDFRGSINLGSFCPSGLSKSGGCRWSKVEPLLKSYLGNSLHLLGTPAHNTRCLHCSVRPVCCHVCRH